MDDVTGKEPKHGGARKGAGRPKSEDPSEYPVYFRLRASERRKVSAAARRAKLSIPAYCKARALDE